MHKRAKNNPPLFVFGEWFGDRCVDNSLYLANYVSSIFDNACKWITKRGTDTHLLSDKVEVLFFDDDRAKRILQKADVIIVNQGISDFPVNIKIRRSALTVNLWHGIAWKKIGFDGINNTSFLTKAINALRIIRAHFDLYVAPSDEFQRIMEKAFILKSSAFIKAGQPRNSLFYDVNSISEAKDKLKKSVNNPNAKIIAYLPTFRDTQTEPFTFSDIHDYEFEEWLKKENIYIIQKSHFASKANIGSGKENIVVNNDMSAQELMLGADMLITDYSSCFFDYLLLDRPIVHYIYDYLYYKDMDRGLYYDKNDVVCGPAVENQSDLIAAIKEGFINPQKYHNLREKRKKFFLTFENDRSCELILNRILKEIHFSSVNADRQL